jgi:hypothetical protein
MIESAAHRIVTNNSHRKSDWSDDAIEDYDQQQVRYDPADWQSQRHPNDIYWSKHGGAKIAKQSDRGDDPKYNCGLLRANCPLAVRAEKTEESEAKQRELLQLALIRIPINFDD